MLRLDPLSEEDIKAVLRKNHNVEDPDAFVDKAQQRGVAALLENPLSLKLLAKAVLNKKWPDSRIHTFEMACETLADESNEEHRYATIRERANTEVLLDTAGQLCAVQLLAGAPGIQLSAGNQDENFIKLNELTGAGRALQLESLKTRLFEAPNSEFAIPLHRQVAEFLGARYLAKLLENGLPVNRVLALISGHDGMIVTEMRGLCAWLAVHSNIAREEIIRRDPIGTVLYGDVAGFPAQVKKLILGELEKVSEKDPMVSCRDQTRLAARRSCIPGVDERNPFNTGRFRQGRRKTVVDAFPRGSTMSCAAIEGHGAGIDGNYQRWLQKADGQASGDQCFPAAAGRQGASACGTQIADAGSVRRSGAGPR